MPSDLPIPRPGLKRLTKHFLGRDFQQGYHTAVDDAQAAMDLWQHYWDN